VSDLIKDFNSRDTKAVILAAYKELAKAYKALEKGAKSASSTPASATTSTALVKLSDAPPPSGSLGAQLSGIGSHIGEHTNSLQRRLTAEAVTLLGLHHQVNTLRAKLKQLYEIDAGEGALAKLIESYEQRAAAASVELTNNTEAAKKALTEKREQWAKAKQVHEQEVAGRAAEQAKVRAREAEAYEYDLDQRRKQEQDERAQAAKAFAAELGAQRETKQAEWAAREKAIAEREAELETLEHDAAGLDAAMAEARKRGESMGMGIARRDTKSAAELAKKDTDGKRRVYELRITGLEETLAKQAAQIDALSKQLDTALGQAQDLAVKAIEGASNSTSFDAIREIAMEQAKNSSKGK
jgi:chromosome segregation ATPase